VVALKDRVAMKQIIGVLSVVLTVLLMACGCAAKKVAPPPPPPAVGMIVRKSKKCDQAAYFEAYFCPESKLNGNSR
jgi:hypothetical protein